MDSLRAKNKNSFKAKNQSRNGPPQKWRGNNGRPNPKSRFTSQDKQKHAAKIKMQNKVTQKAQETEKLQKERELAKQEKQERIQAYKKKRMERSKVISKKTKRGQPLMKDRMQLLLKQIQELKKTS